MSITPIEFTYEATAELGKLAARRFIQRQHAKALVFVAVIAVGCTVAAAMGYQKWYVIVALTISYSTLFRWYRYYAHSDVNFRDLDNPRVIIRLTDDGIEVEMEGQFSRCQWRRVQRVMRFPDVWLLLMYQDGPSVPIPAEHLTTAAQDLIADGVIKSGGTIN